MTAICQAQVLYIQLNERWRDNAKIMIQEHVDNNLIITNCTSWTLTFKNKRTHPETIRIAKVFIYLLRLRDLPLLPPRSRDRDLLRPLPPLLPPLLISTLTLKQNVSVLTRRGCSREGRCVQRRQGTRDRAQSNREGLWCSLGLVADVESHTSSQCFHLSWRHDGGWSRRRWDGGV